MFRIVTHLFSVLVLARSHTAINALVVDAEAVLGRWKATGWTASPFREIENAPSAREPAGTSKALQEAAKRTRDITSFFARPAPSAAAT